MDLRMAPSKRSEKEHDVQAPPGRGGVFTCFADLPREIQLTVWKIATKHCTARILTFAFPSADRPQHLVTNSEPPALLLACRDSRHAALQDYKLCDNHVQSKPYYMNLQRDAILLEHSNVDCFFHSLPNEGLDLRLGVLALQNMSEFSFQRVYATFKHSLYNLLSTIMEEEGMSNSPRTIHDYSFKEIILIYDENPPNGVPLTSDTAVYFNLLQNSVECLRKIARKEKFRDSNWQGPNIRQMTRDELLGMLQSDV